MVKDYIKSKGYTEEEVKVILDKVANRAVLDSELIPKIRAEILELVKETMPAWRDTVDIRYILIRQGKYTKAMLDEDGTTEIPLIRVVYFNTSGHRYDMLKVSCLIFSVLEKWNSKYKFKYDLDGTLFKSNATPFKDSKFVAVDNVISALKGED